MQTRRQFLTVLTAGGAAALCRPAFALMADALAAAPAATRWPLAAPPVVGRVTGERGVVHLVTSSALDRRLAFRVRWTKDADSPRAVSGTTEAQLAQRPLAPVELPVTVAAPDSEVRYQVEYALPDQPDAWKPAGPPGRFRTQRPSGEAFDYVVVADAHWGEDALQGEPNPRLWTGLDTMRQIGEDRPFDFCIDLGDHALLTDGVETPAQAVYKYLRYRERMAAVLARTSLYAVLGNHEQEAGYFRRGTADDFGELGNRLGPSQYHQKWATDARLLCVPNPGADTYPEGGEGAPGFETAGEWGAGREPWNDGTAGGLQNFYAWTWGDALFVVLDPFRYTRVDSPVMPTAPEQWTLGATQMRWFERTLARSGARWKFVFCHHVLGGVLMESGVAYGRGSAIEAARSGTEQARIHELMQRHGAQFFVYGHDHAFCHSRLGRVHYLCCARPTWLSRWWSKESMLESYGDIRIQGRDKPWVEALYNVLGYTRFYVTPDCVRVTWVRSGYSFRDGRVEIDRARRDWGECWMGFPRAVESPEAVTVDMTPHDVDGVRTVEGARIGDFFSRPRGDNYYVQPERVRPEAQAGQRLRLRNFPERVAIVDMVPNVMREWTLHRDEA